jgi:hypothetical protein
VKKLEGQQKSQSPSNQSKYYQSPGLCPRGRTPLDARPSVVAPSSLANFSQQPKLEELREEALYKAPHKARKWRCHKRMASPRQPAQKHPK